MDSVTFTDPVVIGLSESMVFSKHNGKVDTTFSGAHGVVAYPTVVLVKPNGMELDRLVGYYPPEKFVPALFDILRNRNTLDDYLTRLAEHPDSFELRSAVAEKYGYRGDRDMARKHYNYFLENDAANANGFTDDALLALGQLEVRAKNYDTAIDYFERIRAEYPSCELYEEASLWVPYTYMREGKNAEAIERFGAFMQEFPESEEIEWVEKQIAKLKEKQEE